ncbi:hypothetical protein FHG87_019412 [Trinorchestia longiramus]|nr:hypothetical protein FHG87_019412 [Trinorchestia longiramus]
MEFRSTAQELVDSSLFFIQNSKPEKDLHLGFSKDIFIASGQLICTSCTSSCNSCTSCKNSIISCKTSTNSTTTSTISSTTTSTISSTTTSTISTTTTSSTINSTTSCKTGTADAAWYVRLRNYSNLSAIIDCGTTDRKCGTKMSLAGMGAPAAEGSSSNGMHWRAGEGVRGNTKENVGAERGEAAPWEEDDWLRC